MAGRFYIYLFLLLLSCQYSSAQYSKQLLLAEDYFDKNMHYTALDMLEKMDVNKLSKADKAFRSYLLASGYTYVGHEDKAFEYYLKAKAQYKEADSIDKAMDINIDIAYLISAQDYNKNNYIKYIEEYQQYVTKQKDTIKIAKGYCNMAVWMLDNKENERSRDYYLKALKFAEEKNNIDLLARIYHNVAVVYNERLQKPDSALYYLKKDREIVNSSGTVDDLCSNYINVASSYHHKQDYDKAIEYLHLAESLPIQKYTLRTKQYIYEFLAGNYQMKGDIKNAYKYLVLNKQFADSLKSEEQNIAINDIQTKYKTKEKELENQLLRSDNETNRILIYTFTGLLAASLVIGFLVFKNAKRKEKILKQEKLIEQQKLEKALKEYELQSIDLMLEGQEKERQRIANDLHDNLGSMLATLKLNFENLKIRKNELREEENRLYQKTDELIEEAYQKVRRMAHAKNAGVFASEGLIPTLKKLAEKISIPGKLLIEVNAFGFDERLENKMEIAIFRMVQELSTNIIKHSGATEASVQLTNHDDNINIIIEDNGVGMDTNIIGKADGMGLDSIKKKTEQLGGTFTIDSKKGKGTTIIIDLPI
ncbi:sensor histidine kinase [Flavobacterium coralii]|uniref:tetratricopeptide repeat-containing sensor histidine kinase n=1 Tax=Flavobacterium coralii TaxID=2838017 RepID=UPI0032B2E18F|tara:strand:+ start:1339 stop:3117 length:1779 start_codon:yes stop_codon:yes gene_type:complete